MELSNEDSLRLNVLLASGIEAIRIDESYMTLYGLTPRGEAKIQLNPTCRDELYLKRVREAISSHVLGSPGGYPVYLRRWTRMGQARDDSLEHLLMLGEPEAVVAVVHASGLTPELARRAWWAMPEADNARCMLEREQIAGSSLGRELAQFLIDYMPFEEDQLTLSESVRLSLQPGLIDEDSRAKLWAKGKHKNAYYLGFLGALPDDLPEASAPRADLPSLQADLQHLASQGNPLATLLLRQLSAAGQQFLHTCGKILQKPANQDIVNRLLDILAAYHQAARPQEHCEVEIESLLSDAPAWAQQNPRARDIVTLQPQLQSHLQAAYVLSRLSYAVVRPVFSRSDAIGSLMRRKLEPVTTPIFRQLECLYFTPLQSELYRMSGNSG